MNNYTTGDIAKLCGVTVRTVQYYDTRGILTPSALSEGGRRLYSETDLDRMKIICYLRELGLSIDDIGRILKEEDSEAVISLVLDERSAELRRDLHKTTEKLNRVEELRRALAGMERVSLDSIGDVALLEKNRRGLHRVRMILLLVGIIMDVIEVGTLILWIKTGLWLPFAVGMPLVLLLGIWVIRFYMAHTVYICPTCHAVFRPSAWSNLWAWHTPRARRLTCPACGHRSFCVETYNDKES